MAKKRGPIKDPIVFAKLVLRGASIRWYARNEALKLQRVERGLYRCAICGNNFKKQELQADHNKPVVDVKKGDEGLEEWVRRLFCGPENYQWICKNDHEVKTQLENQMRKFYRDEKKALVKKKK